VRNLFTASDQVTFTHGRHSFRLRSVVPTAPGQRQSYTGPVRQASFTNLQTFLQGKVSTYTYAPSFMPLSWRSIEGAFYAEDAIKMKPSLELRIGLRGEFTNGWNEAHGRASNYAFDTAGVIVTQPVAGNSPFTVNKAKFLPRRASESHGLHWHQRRRLIRAGAGLYYALLDNLSYRLDQNGPYNTVFAVKNIGVFQASLRRGVHGCESNPEREYSRTWRTPTVESWTLKSNNSSRQTLHSASVTSDRMVTTNCFPLMRTCQLRRFARLRRAQRAIQLERLLSIRRATGQQCRVEYHAWFSEGISSYHGLELDVNRRMGHGLQFRGVYTFSKALDDGDSMNTSVATNSPAFVANPLQPKTDYGRASFDIHHARGSQRDL